MQSCEVLVAFGGDVILARRQHIMLSDILRGRRKFDLPSFENSDLRIVNLECVISGIGERGVDKNEGGPYYFRARPEMIEILEGLAVDAVTTANNHVGDYGPQALLDQARWLDAAGVAHAGSGREREAAFSPRFLSRNGLRIALFSVDATQKEFAASETKPGTAFLAIKDAESWFEEFQPRIEKAREIADVVLVSPHWGPNLKKVPGPRQIAAGHALIDAGADAILGTSAHVLQAIEVYKGRPILHDAGNFICDFSDGHSEGAIFRLRLSKHGVMAVEMIPLQVAAGDTRELTGSEAEEAARSFADLCHDLGTDIEIEADGRARVTLNPSPITAPSYHRGRKISDHTVQSVPECARLTAIDFGPLTLLGIAPLPADIRRRQMLWVETFWTSSQKINKRLFFELRAVPMLKSNDMPAWGKNMWHEPCDWMLPTTEWEPGVIYREHFGLRPPPIRRMQNGDMELEIRVKSMTEVLRSFRTGRRTSLALPEPS